MERTIEFIEEVVCAGENIDKTDLHSPCRKNEYVQRRQLIMCLALMFGVTQDRAERYYDRGHPSASTAREIINGYCDIYPAWKERITIYKGIIGNEKIYKFWEHEQKLNNLRKETNELVNQLNEITL